MAHVILAEGLWDREFVEDRTEGFEELRATVEVYSPAVAAEIAGVSVDSLVEAARAYARVRPAAIFYTMGLTQHVTGHLNVLSLANLALLTGNLGKPGAGVNPLRGQNNVQGASDMGALPNFLPGYQRVNDPEARRKFEVAWGVSLPQAPGITVMDEIARLTPSYGGASYARLDGEGLQWPCPTIDHPGTPILHVTSFPRGRGRLHGVNYIPPDERPDAEFPMVLTTGRVMHQYHSRTMTGRSPGLDALRPEPEVEINPQDAEGAANLLTNPAVDPVARIPEVKVCAVRLEVLGRSPRVGQ